MGILGSIFTWWNGATIGTALHTRFGGSQVGDDGFGNLYFESSKATDGHKRRWMIYKGSNDASRVPPEWNSWLRGQVDDVPDRSLPPARIWEKPPEFNQTGTNAAYRPAGALEAGGRRPAATGDYEAWSPDDA